MTSLEGRKWGWWMRVFPLNVWRQQCYRRLKVFTQCPGTSKRPRKPGAWQSSGHDVIHTGGLAAACLG